MNKKNQKIVNEYNFPKDKSLVFTTEDNNQNKNKKIILIVFGSVIAIIAAVILIIKLIPSQADCNKLSITMTRDGIISLDNYSTRGTSAGEVAVIINNKIADVFQVSKIKALTQTTLGSVQTPKDESFSWRILFLQKCEYTGFYPK